MSKVAGFVSKVAAVVATAAAIAALFVPGFQILGVGLLTIASAASAVSAVAGAVAYATQKKPEMQGSLSQVVIGRNLPIPCILGRTYAGGFQIYDKSAPPADNKNRTQIMVVSVGPIEGFDDLYGDYTAINFSLSTANKIEGVASGFYGADGGYLWANSRLGARPDTALTPFAGRPAWNQWDSTYKLSGFAAYSVTMEFDEEGVRYSAGIPQWGVVARGPAVYDPRADSTYPGGSGAQRWDNETTWGFGGIYNAALQALTYARGRFVGDVKVFGCGLEFDDILVDQFVELANICEANSWEIGGQIYEGPGTSKWDNLKKILQACAAEPVWCGGKLGVKMSAPRTSLVTITEADLTDGEVSVQAMKSWRDKVNTIIPRVRLEDQRWEYTQIEEVTSTTYVTEDGEEKSKEMQYDLVQDVTQGAQLAAYDLVNSRELGPIVIGCKPHLNVFRVGEAVDLDLPEAGLENQLAIITGRQIDPTTGAVTFTLESETTAKHAFALGATSTAPPTPTLVPPEDLDDVVSGDSQVPADPTSITLVEWTNRLVMKTDPIPGAKEYRWQIYLSDGTTLKRTITTPVPQMEYSSALAHADGISRSYKVRVAGSNDNGFSATPLMSATQTKTAPAAPTSVAFADGTSTSTVTFTGSGGSTVGYVLAWSTTSGFNPMTQGSLSYALSSPAYTPQIPAATYYGKLGAYDLWTSQPDMINFSAEDSFVITPGSGGDPGGGDGGGGYEGGGGGGGGGMNEF
ncbi:MAG TPA: hypothetical protein VM531_00245 [Sphingomicrobium sp.]|nr:hypothetical protein [Sphingomicrobium sp.]